VETKSAQALRSRLGALLKHRQADPANLALVCDLVDVYLQLGEAAQAEAVLTAALERRPGDQSLLFRASSLALAKADHPEALRILDGLAAQGLDGIPVRCNRALALLWLGRPREVVESLRPLESRSREYPPLLLLLARAHMALQELDAAMSMAGAFLSLRPDDPEGEGLMALLLVDAGRYAEAVPHAAKSLAVNPGQLEALLAQGRIALERQDAAQAIRNLKPALERYPTSGAAWSALAQAQLLRIDLPAAEQALEQALRYMPEHVGTWHLKAWCQIMRGDAAGAQKSYAAAYELDHNFGETHGGLAVTAAMQGQEAEARTAIKRALRLNPKGLSARYAEALLLEREGRADAARAVIDELLNRESTHKGMSYLDVIRAYRAKLGRG